MSSIVRAARARQAVVAAEGLVGFEVTATAPDASPVLRAPRR